MDLHNNSKRWEDTKEIRNQSIRELCDAIDGNKVDKKSIIMIENYIKENNIF
jgi:hypothetical protein